MSEPPAETPREHRPSYGEALASQAFPFVRKAVAGHGLAVLSEPEESGTDEVRYGQQFLAAVLRHEATRPEVEGAVRRLAESPEDPAAARELHNQIREALRTNPDLGRHVAAMKAQEPWTKVLGRREVFVGGDHQGPIHMGDNFLPDMATLATFVPIAGAAAGATVTMVVTWLKQRRSDVRIKATAKDGSTFEVDAKRLLDPQGYTDAFLDRIDQAAQVEILPPGEGAGSRAGRRRWSWRWWPSRGGR